jgi:hypothetical protein
MPVRLAASDEEKSRSGGACVWLSRQTLRTLDQRKNKMADDFEQRIEAIDQMTKEIAEIEHNSWFILDQYKLVQDQISKVRAKYEKRFSGALASEDLLRKKIEGWKEDLSLRNEVMSKSKRKMVRRITGQLKVQVLKAMLTDFANNKIEAVTLDDMVHWCDRKNRSKGAAKILNDLGIGDIAIPSTQFFQTTINGKSIRLFPSEAYDAKKPPEPAVFKVKAWKTWFDKEERRILAGEQTKADVATARKRGAK